MPHEPHRPQVFGLREIDLRLAGRCDRGADAVVARQSFPEPVARLNQGRVWLADDVEEWITANLPQTTDRSIGDGRNPS
jgi:prophage regulatory protein